MFRWLILVAALLLTPSTILAQDLSGQRSDLDAALYNIVLQDSRGWLWWRFDKGSVRNARIESQDATGVTQIYGEYTYNRGRKGWVRVRLKDETVECIRFWNEGSCRPFRRPPSHGLVRGLIEGAASAPTSGGPTAGSGSTGQTCRYEAMPGVPGSRQKICN